MIEQCFQDYTAEEREARAAGKWKYITGTVIIDPKAPRLTVIEFLKLKLAKVKNQQVKL